MNTWSPELCGWWSLPGECLNGHEFAKELLCGREWCPTCGPDDSKVHKRRFARWLPKAQQMAVMGYLVVTMPMAVRERFRDVGELRKFRRSVIRALKARGFQRGLARWHYFGDAHPGVYHPHLNLLVSRGRLPKGLLAEVKQAVKGLLGVEVVVVHYKYTRRPGKMVHWLKYVTRATFRDSTWDEELADRLYRFNNCVAWGRWDGPEAWTLAPGEDAIGEVASLERGYCPFCHMPVEWFGGSANLIKTADLAGLGYQELGAGYWARAGP